MSIGWGLLEFLGITPVKLKMLFLSLHFLTQGVIGPVPAEMQPGQKEIKLFHQQYYAPQLAKHLPATSYVYGFVNRLDIGSRHFMNTKAGHKLKQLSLTKIVNQLARNDQPLKEAQDYLNNKLQITAKDIYALLQSKIEYALPDYAANIDMSNFIIAFYPKTRESRQAYKQLLLTLKKVNARLYREETENDYSKWKISILPCTKIFLAYFKAKDPYYVLTFDNDLLNQFIQKRNSYGRKSLYHKLIKERIIKKMGRGSYNGLYLAIKNLFQKSDIIKRNFGADFQGLYKPFGIKTLFMSEFFKKGLYHDHLEFVYDQQQQSFLRKLSPLPLSKKDFKWLPDDVRFVATISVKQLPNILDWFGDVVYALGGKSEYRSIKREIRQVEKETGIRLEDMFKIMSGKMSLAINANEDYLEDITTSLRHFEKYFPYLFLKKIMIRIEVKDQLAAASQLDKLLTVIPHKFLSSVVRSKHHKQYYYKRIMKFQYERDFISIYWTFFQNELLISFSESNIKKLIMAKKNKNALINSKPVLKKSYHNAISHVWMDYSFSGRQLARLIELVIGDFSKREFHKYGHFTFQYILPIIKEVSSAAGDGYSLTRFTDKGIMNESLSESGISVSSIFSPFSTAWIFGLLTSLYYVKYEEITRFQHSGSRNSGGISNP